MLGSAGSNRIRSALLQTIVGVVDRGLGVREAVDAPRVHFEDGVLYAEPGIELAGLGDDEGRIVRFARAEPVLRRRSGGAAPRRGSDRRRRSPPRGGGGAASVASSARQTRARDLSPARAARRRASPSAAARASPLPRYRRWRWRCCCAAAVLARLRRHQAPPTCSSSNAAAASRARALTLLVNEEGGVRCNGGATLKLSDPSWSRRARSRKNCRNRRPRHLLCRRGPDRC